MLFLNFQQQEKKQYPEIENNLALRASVHRFKKMITFLKKIMNQFDSINYDFADKNVEDAIIKLN